MGTSKNTGIPIIILILLFFMLFSQSIRAGDVGVLVDISGSLRNLPVKEGQALLEELLTKGQIPASWEIISINEESQVGKLLKDKQPLMNPNDRLLLMTFGSKKDPNFPYFTPPRIIKISSPENISQRLVDFYPRDAEDHRDHYTYLDLALAVASESFKRAGADQFLLIVLSDFQESRVLKRDLNKDQEKLESDFRTQQGLEHKQPVNIRHDRNQLLQVRMYEVRYGNAQEQRPITPPIKVETPPLPAKEIRLLAPKGEIDGKKVIFKWTGINGATKYRLECKLGNESKIKVGPTRPSYQIDEALPPGEYTWQVDAIMPDDQKVSPGKGRFKVKGGGSALVLILLIGLPAALAGYYYRKQLLALLGFPRKGTGVS